MNLGPRIVITGPSGSGKTTLARRLGSSRHLPVTDLDRIHWRDQISVKRDEDDAKRMVADISAGENWIIEGVFGWLSEVALPHASSLIWLDVSWDICRAGLEARGRWPGASDEQHADFMRWAEAYWQRTTPSSHAGHRAMFEKFDGAKTILIDRAAIDAL